MVSRIVQFFARFFLRWVPDAFVVAVLLTLLTFALAMGVMGYGLIGAQHVYNMKRQPDAELVALSEVYGPRMDEGAAACGGDVKRYPDFRKMLEDKDVDAVVHAMAGSGVARKVARLRPIGVVKG